MITLDRPATAIDQLPSIGLGELVARAARGDGLDSNGTASVSGGTVLVNGSSSAGNAAVDVNGTVSGQAWITVSFDQAVTAGTEVTITDADGEVVATIESDISTQSLVAAVS